MTSEPAPSAQTKRDGATTLHVALWIAAVPVLLAAVRLLTFSKGDPVLLRVLFENFQVLPLLTATSLLVLPWLALTTALFMIMNRSARAVVSRWVQRFPILATIGIFVIFIVIMTTPFPTTYWIAGLWLAAVAVSVIGQLPYTWAKKVSRGINFADNGTPGPMLYSAVIIPLVMTVLPASSSFWLPLEEVVTPGETYNAYVLGDADGWTTLLTEDRVVIRARSADIIERIVCDQGEAVTLQLLSQELNAPECSA